MNKYAVFSISDNHDYDFFAPLTALFWKRCGYIPHCIQIDVDTNDHKQQFVLDKVREVGGRLQFLPSWGLPRPQAAQISRLFGYLAIGIETWDYVLTADVDMWPLLPSWFEPIDPDTWNLYGANLYADERIPMCYVGAKAALWREVMGDYELATSAMRRIRLPEDPSQHWGYDETLLTEALKSVGGKKACANRDRPGSRHGLPSGRVDRANWVYTGPEEDGLIDAHLPRPGFDPGVWDRIRLLVRDFLPSHLQWADDYCAQYRKLHHP